MRVARSAKKNKSGRDRRQNPLRKFFGRHHRRTDARRSSSTTDGGAPVYLGPANGLVVESSGAPTLYHMGDSGIFGDMALIAELYAPKIGLIPVGGRFTMDGATAALAVKRYFDFETVIPCHYGTFDAIAPEASEFIAAMHGAKTRVWAGAIDEKS